MSVNVNVLSVDFSTKTVLVEAIQNGKQIFKSPMRYSRFTKDSIEKQLRKELKTFDGPLWGAVDIFHMPHRRMIT
ncbi:hypothetical protein EXU29_12230 [Acinetobacter wuhouensis]|uniref:hypothetical protein n=1 Tax=Acinetobacter wuhouensis TaxID=1879050 RepID=UPI001022E778|nr:hypothetical protein [Acinetobacter wuhouensis]RZG71887.1 hypothetical protein EXU29_12230 [Acinetobacter wuhouensis]